MYRNILVCAFVESHDKYYYLVSNGDGGKGISMALDVIQKLRSCIIRKVHSLKQINIFGTMMVVMVVVPAKA